ncbi:MAG: DUF1456 family protein [Methylococcales bacterium]|nr:DUF1456 family protein [Methylococcales bacterium]
MLNNDILRRVRYALTLNDREMIEIFALSEHEISRENLLNLLKKDNEEDFVALDDPLMTLFLDGLITFKRGKLDNNAALPTPKASLTNNVILKKLRIALEFKEEDMLNVFQLADFKLSKGELSAFFRQKGHKHHRDCGDQALRNFLQGLVLHFRSPEEEE